MGYRRRRKHHRQHLPPRCLLTRKRQYSEEEAKELAPLLTVNYGGGAFNAYPCPCGKWHVGHEEKFLAKVAKDMEALLEQEIDKLLSAEVPSVIANR